MMCAKSEDVPPFCADKRYKLAFLTTGKYQYVNKTKIAGNLSRSGVGALAGLSVKRGKL